jgi:hypothetical protein
MKSKWHFFWCRKPFWYFNGEFMIYRDLHLIKGISFLFVGITRIRKMDPDSNECKLFIESI